MKKKPIIAILIAMFIWGTTFILSKDAMSTFKPGFLVFIRALLGCMFLFIFAFGKFNRLNKKLVIFTICTGLAVAGGYITQNIGLQYTTSANSAFLENIYVAIVPFLTWFLVKKRPTVVSFICIGVTLIGVVLISIDNGVDFTSENMLGNILSIASGVFFGINIALTGCLFKDKDMYTYTFIQFATVAVVALIYSLVFERERVGEITFPTLLSVLYLGVFSTGVSWILRNSAQKELSPTTISFFLPFTSLVSMTISIIIGETKVNVLFIIGAFLIVASVFADSFFSHKKLDKKLEQKLEN